jgi:hypothetical protein
MANATPQAWFWLAPLLDVMGTETDWNRGGTWSPLSDEELLYRRALCKGKPYCFLMNTDFTKFPYAATETFMKRALAYGLFPGFFSADASTGHYFAQPRCTTATGRCSRNICRSANGSPRRAGSR